MLEDKKLGLKIAESPEEAFFKTVEQSTQQRLWNAEVSLETEKFTLKYIKNRLKELKGGTDKNDKSNRKTD